MSVIQRLNTPTATANGVKLNIPNITMSATSFRRCNFILNELLSCYDCYQFMTPVPLTAVIYHKEVKHPMDFKTLERNLFSNKYNNYEEFYQDLSLIWENTKLFHRSFDMIYQQAEKLLARYNALDAFLSGGPKPFYLSTPINDVDTLLSELIPEESLYELVEEAQTAEELSQSPTEAQPVQMQVQTEVLFPMYKEIDPPGKCNLYFIQALSEEDNSSKKLRGFTNVRQVFQMLNGSFFDYLADPSQHNNPPLPRFYIAKNRTLLNEARTDPYGVLAVLCNVQIKPINKELCRLQASVIISEPMCETHGFDDSTIDKAEDYEFSPKAWIKLRASQVVHNVNAVINTDMDRNYFKKVYNTYKLSTKQHNDLKKVGSNEIAKEFASSIMFPKTSSSQAQNDFTVKKVKKEKRMNGLADHTVINGSQAAAHTTSAIAPITYAEASSSKAVSPNTHAEAFNPEPEVRILKKRGRPPKVSKKRKLAVDTASDAATATTSSSQARDKPMIKIFLSKTREQIPGAVGHASEETLAKETNVNNKNREEAEAVEMNVNNKNHEEVEAEEMNVHTEDQEESEAEEICVDSIDQEEIEAEEMIVDKNEETPQLEHTHSKSEDKSAEVKCNEETKDGAVDDKDHEADHMDYSSDENHEGAAHSDNWNASITDEGSQIYADAVDTHSTSTISATTSPDTRLEEVTMSFERYLEDENEEGKPPITTNQEYKEACGELWKKLKDYAREKNVPAVDINTYVDRTSGFPNAEGFFKHVYFIKDDPQKVIQTFRKMTIAQRTTEIASLLALKGLPHMGQITEVLTESHGEIVGLAMQRYQKTLKQYTHAHSHHRLSAHQKMDLVIQMLECIGTIHKAGLAHRDLSEVNFMVDETNELLPDGSPRAKLILIDFGKSVFTTDDQVRQWWIEHPTDLREEYKGEIVPFTKEELDTWCQELPWIRSKPDHGYRLYRSIQTLPKSRGDTGELPWLVDPLAEDIYSTGAIIWKIFSDTEPWHGILDIDLKGLRETTGDDYHIECALNREVHGNLSRELLTKMLKVTPQERESASTILAWIRTDGVKNGLIMEWDEHAPVHRQKRHIKNRYDDEQAATTELNSARQVKKIKVIPPKLRSTTPPSPKHRNSRRH